MIARIAALLVCSVAFLSAEQSPSQALINAPYVETPAEVVSAMLRLAEAGPRDLVYDLGCGDGRIVIAAARDFGARGIGLELNAAHLERARGNARHAGVTDRVEFRLQNLFEADLSRATMVTLYLLPEVNAALKPKLLRELKPGTRVVSHAFGLGDWKPDRRVIVRGSTIYLWVVPPATLPAEIKPPAP